MEDDGPAPLLVVAHTYLFPVPSLPQRLRVCAGVCVRESVCEESVCERERVCVTVCARECVREVVALLAVEWIWNKLARHDQVLALA